MNPIIEEKKNPELKRVLLFKKDKKKMQFRVNIIISFHLDLTHPNIKGMFSESQL